MNLQILNDLNLMNLPRDRLKAFDIPLYRLKKREYVEALSSLHSSKILGGVTNINEKAQTNKETDNSHNKKLPFSEAK